MIGIVDWLGALAAVSFSDAQLEETSCAPRSIAVSADSQPPAASGKHQCENSRRVRCDYLQKGRFAPPHRQA